MFVCLFAVLSAHCFQLEFDRSRSIQFSEYEKSFSVPTKCDLHTLPQEQLIERLQQCKKEFAMHITLAEAALFSLIPLSELFNQTWNKPDGTKKAPRVTEMIQRFNSLSGWVTGSIVQSPSLQTRARFFEFFIDLAQLCFELHNFHSVMQILSGVHNSAVSRLHKTMDKVSVQYKARLAQLDLLMSHDENYKVYRTNLRQTARPTVPVVPYLGLVLQDLVFLDEGNKDHTENMLNAYKMTKIYQILQPIVAMQGVLQTKYAGLERNPTLSSFVA